MSTTALRTTPAPRVAAEIEPVSAAALELVLGSGDIGKLTPLQRVEYMHAVCRSLGVNPLTRPFQFLSLNGKVTMYATRDLTDQLRKLHAIDLTITEKLTEGDLFIVTAQARTKDGRKDEDVGAINIKNLAGEARANAIMKALTKAKRRVTLSICGLGFNDESEIETLPGAYTFDAEAEKPVPMITAPPPPAATPAAKPPNGNGHKRKVSEVLADISVAASEASTADDVADLESRDDVRAIRCFPAGHGAITELDAILAEHMSRVQSSQDDPPPPPGDEEMPDTLAQQVAECNQKTDDATGLRELEQHEKSLVFTALLVSCDKAKRPDLAASMTKAADARREILRLGA